jgi:predicted nucleic acid-binding protein
VIADTSAWIEFLRASGSAADLAMQRALQNAESLWVPEVVYREVLQGAGSVPHFIELQTLLDEVPTYVSDDPLALARSASLLYVRCRWQGLTVRSANDCLVAACAIEADEPLLARDRDFAAIARVDNRLQLIS